LSFLVRTLRVPAYPDDRVRVQLDKTFKEYSRAAQLAYDYGFAKNTTNRIKIHHAIYRIFREQSSLNSQLVINAKNKAVDVLQSLKAKRRKITFTSYLPIRYDKRSSTINIDKQVVSLSNIDKRVNVGFTIPQCYEKYLNWEFRSFELVKKGKRYFFHFVVRSFAKVNGRHSGLFVGIDRGMRHIAVTSQNEFHSGSRLREIKDRYFRMKRSLQKKGTPSARKKLRRIAGREKRFQKDQNHCITKQIIENTPINSTIILEDLRGIRKTAKYRRRSRHSRELNSWAYYQFQQFLEYKAKEKNIELLDIDPAYTSQKCSKCGYTARKNRNGANFECGYCGFKLNSDLNASRNIKANYLSDEYIIKLALKAKGFLSGAPVIIPNVTSLSQR